MYEQNNVKKVCNFYVSDLHLITMLLPYLDKQMKSKEEFITVSQKDLIEEVKLVLSRLTLNNQSKEKLLNIDWNTANLYKYETMEKILKKTCNKSNKLSIIVNGNNEYVEIVNNHLDKFLKNNDIKGTIKIINCYDITKMDEDIKEILRTHDIILNTSGEKEISEVFEGYEKRVGA